MSTLLERRNFLKQMATVCGATTLAVIPHAVAATPSPQPTASATPQPQGYRVTEHIKAYYKTL